MSPNFRHTLDGFDCRVSASVDTFSPNRSAFVDGVRSYCYLKDLVDISLDLFPSGFVFARWSGNKLIKWAFRKGYRSAIEEDLTAVFHSVRHVEIDGLCKDRVIYGDNIKFPIDLVYNYYDIQKVLLNTFKGKPGGFRSGWEDFIELSEFAETNYDRLSKGIECIRLRSIRI